MLTSDLCYYLFIHLSYFPPSTSIPFIPPAIDSHFTPLIILQEVATLSPHALFVPSNGVHICTTSYPLPVFSLSVLQYFAGAAVIEDDNCLYISEIRAGLHG